MNVQLVERRITKMSITDELVSNLIETRFEDFPRDVVELAKYAVIDAVGCMVGGANDTGCPMILDLIREWGGKEESTVLVHGVRAPSHNVALANAVMARSFDYGMVDVYVEGKVRPSHIGETLVPTAVAVAEQEAMSGKELLTAFILGEDLVARVMAASIPKITWDITGTGNTLGATAITGRLLGLDHNKMVHAIGIAVNQMGGTTQNLIERVHSFKLGQGLSAQRGIFSVKLADKGFTCVEDPLIGRLGYFDLFSPDYQPDVLTRNLGRKFYSEATFKPYPCCRGTHGGIDCALEIGKKHDIEAGDIDEVIIAIPEQSYPPIIREPFTMGVVPHINAIFSLPYTVACALLRGGVRVEHFTDEALKDPKIAEMTKKVRIAIQEFPNEEYLATTLVVRTKDGRELSSHVNVPKGNEFDNPLSREEKREKFRGNVHFSHSVSADNCEKALSLLENLEDIEDVREIVKLLAG
jgi:2-methylcitrate dehydratase PrpD